jgi:hypothetical protein
LLIRSIELIEATSYSSKSESKNTRRQTKG